MRKKEGLSMVVGKLKAGRECLSDGMRRNQKGAMLFSKSWVDIIESYNSLC